MSDQAPVIAIAERFPASFSPALDDARLFPIIETGWNDALTAVMQVRPCAVVASISNADDLERLNELSDFLAGIEPYTPLIVIDATVPLPIGAVSLALAGHSPSRLSNRLRAALRVRTLHTTVLRRNAECQRLALHMPDPIEDVSVMLLGRGANYPELTVAFGERTGLVGVLTIEAAGKQLNSRDLDGIVIGSGISTRVTDAFVTVLSEDARFRHLPVVVTDPNVKIIDALPNLEFISGDAAFIANNTLPMLRQQALASRLSRALTSLDNDGYIDVRTGLLTTDAFEKDLTNAVSQTQARGGAISAVRLTFDQVPERVLLNAARIASRLLRNTDFGTVCADGSIIMALAEVDMRNAHMIARRLAAVMRHTTHEGVMKKNLEPEITVTTMMPDDQATTMLSRLVPRRNPNSIPAMGHKFLHPRKI